MSKYGGVRKHYYTQDNNPTELMLKIYQERFRAGRIGYLETCGPTAAVRCLAAVDELPEIAMPGGYVPQPEEFLTDFFTDPNNFPDFKRIDPNVNPHKTPANEKPSLYPFAIERVFGKKCLIVWRKYSIAELESKLLAGHSIMVCQKDPGHFISLVDWRSGIIFDDPWAGRWGGDGFNRSMSAEEYENNVHPFALIFGGIQ